MTEEGVETRLPEAMPRHAEVQLAEKKFSYGTCGYRAKWTLLAPKVLFRTAYYAASRARWLQKAVGLMITASHNPAEDNGVKIVDWDGQMLPVECEAQLDQLVNFDDEGFRSYCFEHLLGETSQQQADGVKVVIGTDTRESSPLLLKEAVRGCRFACIPVEIYERHTTPQLHFIVRALNDRAFADPAAHIQRFHQAFSEGLKLIPAATHGYTNEVYLDCANGVGALWIEKYIEGCGDALRLTLLNAETEKFECLNQKCGADHVKIAKTFPTAFHAVPAGARCASLDGDADRLIYFYSSTPTGELRLLDGDHICALFAKFIKEQFNASENTAEKVPLTFGVVQTAYSNGNAARYFREQLMIEPVMVKTGVKHLDKAARNFDIGIYFEANGHGTISFSKAFYAYVDSFKQAKEGGSQDNTSRHVLLLALLSKLVNEIVGDGIADFLAVETLLRYYNWSIADWEAGTYIDLPSRQLKVKVKNRALYESHEDNEAQLLRPAHLQAGVDNIVSGYNHSRAFIRPSGTEEIVRIYAEAETQTEADKIAKQVEELILIYETLT